MRRLLYLDRVPGVVLDRRGADSLELVRMTARIVFPGLMAGINVGLCVFAVVDGAPMWAAPVFGFLAGCWFSEFLNQAAQS